MAMGSCNTDVKTSLNYSVDDGARQHYVAYQPTDEEKNALGIPAIPMQGGNNAVETTVYDGRGKDLTLDVNSFALVQQTTTLSTEDFYKHPEKITDVYYTEMADMFKKATGAVHVQVFHHQVRSSNHNADGNGFNTSVQPYAHGIHSDSSAHSAEQLFLKFAGTTVDRKYCKGRFVYINAWRNIADTPIEDDALAVCDETSLVKPDDYLGSDLYMPGGVKLMQYRLSDRNAACHRWYYFSQMKKDDVLLFKQWDSDPTLSGRLTFHTAFKNPNAQLCAPSRQSIECRALLFFPSHEPNTCPALPEPESEAANDDLDEDPEVKAAVKKVLGLIDTMHAWPAFAKTWILSTINNKDGARQIAKTIVQDDQNYHGYKKYSAEKKAKIVELLYKNNWETKLKAKVAHLKSMNTDSRTFTILPVLPLLALSFISGYMFARRGKW